MWAPKRSLQSTLARVYLNVIVFLLASDKYQPYFSKRWVPCWWIWQEPLHLLMTSLLQVHTRTNFWRVYFLFSNGFNNMGFLWEQKNVIFFLTLITVPRVWRLEPGNISAIKNMPKPVNISRLRSFLGFEILESPYERRCSMEMVNRLLVGFYKNIFFSISLEFLLTLFNQSFDINYGLRCFWPWRWGCDFLYLSRRHSEGHFSCITNLSSTVDPQ